MKNNPARRLTAALCLLVLLATGPWPARGEAIMTESFYREDVTLYLPDFERSAVTERTLSQVEISTSRPLEETLLRLLLTEISASLPASFSALKDLSLLPPGYLRSLDVAIIHLSGEILGLDPLSRYTLCQAITDTVCGPGNVSGCLILSDGHALALDEMGTIPAGVFQPGHSAEALTAMSQLLLRQTDTALHYQGVTALFYPASAGHGIVCQVQSLPFTLNAPEDIALTILRALSQAALFDVPAMPDLEDYLSEPPILSDLPDGTRLMTLRFDASLMAALSECGVLRSVLMAAITFSLQGYMPWIDGVRCEVGSEPILAIVPVGLYDGANDPISFERGYMLWQDFAHFVLTHVRLYFVDEQRRLAGTARYLPASWATDPLQLLDQLFTGPSYYDASADLHPVFASPDTFSLTLKAIATDQRRVTLDFSVPFWIEDAEDLTDEQNAVYAMVNVLTDLPWCREVVLTVNGAAPEGQLAYDTPFLRSPDYRGAGGGN